MKVIFLGAVLLFASSFTLDVWASEAWRFYAL